MKEGQRSLLCIDMAYTMQTVRKTNRLAFCNARHFLGVFQRVYALHPLSDVAGGNASGEPSIHRLSKDQVVVEGVAFKFNLPAILKPLDLLLSQALLLRRMARVIRSKGVHAIYATDPYYSGLFGLLLKLLTGTRLVVLVAANYDEIYAATRTLAYPRLFRYRWVENAVSGLVLRAADLVAGGNRNNLECALNHGANPARSTIFTSALNIDKSHQVPPETRDRECLAHVFGDRPWLVSRPRLLFVGRLQAVKMPQDALAAMEIVCRANPEVVGVVAGDGPLRAELESWVHARGLHDRILFAGNVEQGVLASLIAGSIIVSPLTGMALIEAGLGGAAIVAYDRDWQADFITDGVDGYIVPFRDVQAMAARAGQLLAEPETRAAISRRIREKSLDLTSMPKLRRHFEEQWSRVLA